MPRDPAVSQRGRLSRELVVESAIALADEHGIESISMRRLATQLGVDPMSLYRYVRDKDDLLAAMADAVVVAIGAVPPGGQWAQRMRRLILAARAQMLLHPWCVRVIEDRADPTPAGLVHMNAVVGVLLDGGFTLELAHHALHVLGSRVLGFSQDLFNDAPDVRPAPEVAVAQAAMWAQSLPYLAELAVAASHEGALGGCDDDEEFAFSLDLILDGLERRRAAV